ncbi:MAG: lectin-like protein [Rhodothermales bacterium]
MSFFAFGANAVTVGGPVINPANNHTYYLLEADTWTGSQASAQTLGGSLVTINDQAENDFVLNTFGATRHLWLGFNDAALEGDFVWANGETSSFTNWVAGEPNNAKRIHFGYTEEDYTMMWAAGTKAGSHFGGGWNDYGNVSTMNWAPVAGGIYGVVEIATVPVPAAGLLLGSVLGLGGLFGARKSRGNVA